MHGGFLWLDKEYLVHAVQIERLRGLSMARNTVLITFHTTSKQRRP